MKIAVFNNCYGKGGVARAFYEFMRVLSQRGHKLDLFIFSNTCDTFLPTDDFIINKYIFEIKSYKSLDYRYNILGVIFNFLRKINFFNKLRLVSKKMAEKINDGDYDMVFADFCRFTHAPYILRYLKIPNIYFCHAPLRIANEPLKRLSLEQENRRRRRFFSFTFIPNTIQLLDRKLSGRIDRINARSAMKILTNSYYTREYIYKAYGVDSKVNYLGVDNKKFRNFEVKKDNFILSVGGLESLKQFDFIVASMSLISKEKRPRLILVGLRGTKSSKEFLKKLSQAKEVDLEIKEEISDNELVNLYNQASMVVFVPFMEPFGFIPLEAMACGTPVIGIREGGVRESIKDGQTGILIDRDRQELAMAIESLLEDKNFAETLRQKAQDEINRNWSWEKATDRLEKNLIEVIEKKQFIEKKGK